MTGYPSSQLNQELKGSGAAAPAVLFVLLSGILLLQMYLKVRLFEGLTYTSDLFNLLQGSTSILQGRPLFFENCSGDGSYTHNYFFMLLLSPGTYLFGAYGFFISLTLAGMYACWSLLRGSSALIYTALVLGIFAVGPVAFWLFDDPIYGWHNELFYLPLSILAVSCYLRQRTYCFYISLLLVASVKEDGAVLACAIHLITLIHAYEGSLQRAVTPLIKAILFWAGVFILGMFILKGMSPRGTSRLSGALESITIAMQDATSIEYIREMMFHGFVLAAAGAGILLLFLRPQFVALGLLLSVPVLLVQGISTLAYYPHLVPMRYHGITWPARWVSLWSILCVICLLGERREIRIFGYIQTAVPLLLLHWFAQAFALDYTRQYSILDSLSMLSNKPSSRMYLPLLKPKERFFLGCLQESLPLDTPVAVGGMLFGIFHRHDVAAASHEKTRYRASEVYVCDMQGRLPFEGNCNDILQSLPKGLFEASKVLDLSYAATKKYKDTVEGCAEQARKKRFLNQDKN